MIEVTPPIAVPNTARPRFPDRLAHRARQIAQDGRALLGLFLLAVVLGLAVISLLWTPYPADQVNVTGSGTDLHPRLAHLAGTDELGRDIFSRIMVGIRTSLIIATTAVSMALVVGGTIGFVTGQIGGALDIVVSRIIDVLLAIPALVIALGIVAILGPSAVSVSIALAAGYTPTFARVIRSNVVGVRDRPYVEASRGLGVSQFQVMRRDILPNVLPLIAVQVTTALAWAMLDEAALGFLGLGVQPPNASLGSLLQEGREYLYQEPWLPVAAGIAVVLTVLGINLFGDALRDLLDPRKTTRR